MKKICYFFIAIALFFSTNAYAREGWEGTFADEVRTDTVYFNGVLSSLDTDVQKALETIDELASSDSLDGVFWRLDGTNAPATGDFYTTANFGIGTAPSYPLHIEKTFTDLSSGIYGEYHQYTVSSDSDVSTDQYGSQQYIIIPNTNAKDIRSIEAAYYSSIYNGSGDVTFLLGIAADNYALAASTGAIGEADAFSCSNYLYGTGNIGIAKGLWTQTVVSGRALTDNYGIYIITPQTASGGTITNNYGIYLEDQSAIGDTLNYSIYSGGGDNYFGGYTEIELADQDAPAIVTSFKVGTPTKYLEFTEADLNVVLPGLGKYLEIKCTTDSFLGSLLFLPQTVGLIDYAGSGSNIIFVNNADFSSSFIYAYWNHETYGDYLRFDTDTAVFTGDVLIEGELSFEGDLNLADGASINFNGGAYIDEFWSGSGYDISINSLQVDANTSPFFLRPAWHISGGGAQYWDTVENSEDNSYLWQFRQYGDYQQGTSKPGAFTITSNGIMIGNGYADKDYYLKFLGETNSFEMQWLEDEDYLLFKDDIFIQAGETIKHDGDVGLEFQTLQSVWPFKYAAGLGADNAGMYFNLDNPADPYVEFRLNNIPMFSQSVLTGDLTIGNGTGDVVLNFHGTTDGGFAYRTIEQYFEYLNSILMSSDLAITFGTSDQYIYNDGTDLVIGDASVGGRLKLTLGGSSAYLFNYGDSWFSFNGNGTPDTGCDFNVPYADDGSGFYIGYGATQNSIYLGTNGSELTINPAGTATSTANWTFDGTATHAAGIIMNNSVNIQLGTSTGTKIGTATNQKLGFFNATPVIKPTSTTDLRTALINLGLYTTGGASPLNLNGGTLTAGNATIGTLTGMIKGTAGVLSAASGGTDYENPLTFSSPLSRLVNTVSIPVATTGVNGYLSSTDWNTFNGKESVLTFSTGLTRAVNTITTNDSQIDHDALLNFLTTEHYLQTAITNVSTALATGLLKVTTGTGALSVVTDSSTNWDTAYTHSGLTNNPHTTTLEQARTAGATMAGDFSMGTHKITSLETCTADGDAASKGYVDSVVSGLVWQQPVLDFWDASGGLPVSPDTGDRYICSVAGNGWTLDYLYEYDGASWDEYVPDAGWACWVDGESQNYVFNGTDWVVFSGSTTPVHNNLTGLQGGTTGQYYHLTSAQHTIATQAATTSLSGYLTDTDWDTFNNKEPAISAGTTAQYWRGDKSWQTLSTAVLPLLSSTATGLTYTSGTGVFSLTSGYIIPTTTEQTNWGTAYSHTSLTNNPHSTTFLQLTDTPSAYTSQSLKSVRVNVGETALEFYTPLNTDELAKVSTDDTTAGYLGAKILGTTNLITATETGGGGNETLVLNIGTYVFNTNTMTTDSITQGSTNLWYVEATAEDAVGALFTDTNSIDFTYTANTSIIADLKYQDTTEIDLTVDASGLKADIKAGSIADSKLAAITTASKVNGSALYSLGSIDAGAGLIPNANIAAITTASKVSGAALYSLASIPAGGGTIPIANIPIITTAKGGTGLDSSGQTGIPKVVAGTWTFNANQDNLGDGTTYKQYNPANVAITGGSIEDVSLISATTLTIDSPLAIDYGGTGQITANAALNAFLPSQTGNTGKVLGTDGSATSWVSIPSDDDFVDVTTNQSVGGIKTFTSFPVTPSSAPTTDYQVANKKYVVDNAVFLTGNQSVGGIKTFTSFPVTPSSAPSSDYQTANKKYVDDTAVEADTLADVTGRGATTTTAMTVAELQSTTTIGFDAEYDNGDSGATKTIDWTAGNKQKITLTSAPCVFTFTAPAHPCNLTLKVVQDSGGSKTATWPATVKWPSGTVLVLSTGAGAIDIVSFYYDGTNYYAVGNIGFS